MLLSLGSRGQGIYRRASLWHVVDSNVLLTSDFAQVDTGTKLLPLLNAAVLFGPEFTTGASAPMALALGHRSKQWSAEAYAGVQGIVNEPATAFYSLKQRSEGTVKPLLGGYVQYQSKLPVTVRMGYDRLFIGPGIHSLLLSNQADPFPFLRLQAKIWRFNYSFVTGWLDNISPAGDFDEFSRNKGMVTHVLAYRPSDKFYIEFFESIVWQTRDSLRSRWVEPAYLNPLVFLRPVEFSLGSPDNAVAGFSIQWRLGKAFYLYGQGILDEFLLRELRAGNGWWANKFGLQAGLKWFNALGIAGLTVIGEANGVRPFTYTHQTTRTNYAHARRPLAHSWGANFGQLAGLVQYKKKRHRIQGSAEWGLKGFSETAGREGEDLFESYNRRSRDYGNTWLQGNRETLYNVQLSYGYCPKNWRKTELFASFRVLKTQKSEFKGLELGLRTPFFTAEPTQ